LSHVDKVLSCIFNANSKVNSTVAASPASCRALRHLVFLLLDFLGNANDHKGKLSLASVEDVAVGEIGAIFESATDFARLAGMGVAALRCRGMLQPREPLPWCPDSFSVSFSSFVLVLDCSSSLFEDDKDSTAGGGEFDFPVVARRFRAGPGAVDQAPASLRTRSLPLGFLDARKFAVNFRAHRFVFARAVPVRAGAHGVQNVVGVDGLQRTRGRVGGFGAGDFGDEPRGKERLQDLLREPGGMPNSVEISWMVTGGRPLWKRCPMHVISRSATNSRPRLVDVLREFVLQIRPRDFGRRRSTWAPKSKISPGKIKSDHEHRHEAEAAVNIDIGNNTRKKRDSRTGFQMPQRPAHDTADQRRAETDAVFGTT